jgi:hypothetical protein
LCLQDFYFCHFISLLVLFTVLGTVVLQEQVCPRILWLPQPLALQRLHCYQALLKVRFQSRFPRPRVVIPMSWQLVHQLWWVRLAVGLLPEAYMLFPRSMVL